MLLLRPDVEKLTAKHDVKGLIKALHYSRDRHVAAAAAESLGGLGDDRAVEPLITALDDDVDREPVIAALGRLGDPRAVDRLVRVVADGPAWLRDPAVAALVMIGAPAADFFVTTLQADDDALRTLAAHTLGTIGDDHAVGPLVAALRESIRSFGLDALAGAVPLNVDLDVVLTVLAHTVCAAMRRRLPGYATTTPDILQRRFLQTSGEILNRGDEIIVRLNRRAYSPVLRQAELPTVTVPWWGNRRLSYQFT